MCGIVPVQSNDTKIEDGSSAAENIRGQPELAGHGAKHPPSNHSVGNIERQHCQGNLQHVTLQAGAQSHLDSLQASAFPMFLSRNFTL